MLLQQCLPYMIGVKKFTDQKYVTMFENHEKVKMSRSGKLSAT